MSTGEPREVNTICTMLLKKRRKKRVIKPVAAVTIMPLKQLFASLMALKTLAARRPRGFQKNLHLKWIGVALADSLDGVVDRDNTNLWLGVHF